MSFSCCSSLVNWWNATKAEVDVEYIFLKSGARLLNGSVKLVTIRAIKLSQLCMDLSPIRRTVRPYWTTRVSILLKRYCTIRVVGTVAALIFCYWMFFVAVETDSNSKYNKHWVLCQTSTKPISYPPLIVAAPLVHYTMRKNIPPEDPSKNFTLIMVTYRRVDL